jgi:ribosomal protein L40E
MQSYITPQQAEPTAPPEKIDSEEFEEYLLEYLDLSASQTEIIPVPASNAEGAVFPAIQEKLDIETSRLMVFFKKLLEKGILKIGGIEFKKAVCPRCYSAQNIVSLKCKKCKSANLSRQRILQHESCGFLGPEEHFYESGRWKYLSAVRNGGYLWPASLRKQQHVKG